MGGKVHVESELGEGSKFIITMQVRVIDTIIFNTNSYKIRE